MSYIWPVAAEAILQCSARICSLPFFSFSLTLFPFLLFSSLPLPPPSLHLLHIFFPSSLSPQKWALLIYIHRVWGSAISSPSSRRFPAESNLVHFSHKIWHLLAKILMIFHKTKWPNFGEKATRDQNLSTPGCLGFWAVMNDTTTLEWLSHCDDNIKK